MNEQDRKEAEFLATVLEGWKGKFSGRAADFLRRVAQEQDSGDDRVVFGLETKFDPALTIEGSVKRMATAMGWTPPGQDSGEAVHPDDLAVDRFAAAMKLKLAKKREEGYGGWDNPDGCSLGFLSEKLRHHAIKGDPVDVANFCMMLHERGSRILAHPQRAMPMTKEQIHAAYISPVNDQLWVYKDCFVAGVRSAEAHHGIGAKP